jgi:hypothetical protein
MMMSCVVELTVVLVLGLAYPMKRWLLDNVVYTGL